MTIYVALLRAVNVGGTKKIAMSALRDFAQAVGLKDPQTVLQSGNVIFDSPRSGHELEAFLEQEAESRLGLKTDFLLRSAKEWASSIANNPFVEEAAREPAHLVLMPLKRAPNAAGVKTLADSIAGPERIQAHGSNLYIVYPAGIGTSRLTTKLIETKLQMRGTSRNWNTVLKLAAMVKDLK